MALSMLHVLYNTVNPLLHSGHIGVRMAKISILK